MAVLLRFRIEIAGEAPREVVIDDARPLGPQIDAARSVQVPWKILERVTGFTERHLRNMAGAALLPIFRNDNARVRKAH